jgi:hypothetical protein
MFKLLRENNEQLVEMVKQLDSKIIKLKAANQIAPEYLTALLEYYQEAVLPWMEEYYTVNKEIEPEKEQLVQDKIYDLFLLLQALED